MIMVETRKIEHRPAIDLITGSALSGYSGYLTDESRRPGQAEALALPRNLEEVAAAVLEAASRDWPITVSGARTGLAAGAVPEGGLVISLERMNRALGLRRLEDGRLVLRCQAGFTLQALQGSLRRGKFTDSSDWDQQSLELLDELARDPRFFPPDPTETSASLGGIAACNASGAHTFRYGPARSYVNGLTVIMANGERLDLERGQAVVNRHRRFSLQTAEGELRSGRAPGYRLPQTKNAAGYFSRPNLDLIDLFIGSEGTLGIIAELEIILLPQPPGASANLIFLDSEAAALELVENLRARRQSMFIEALEYFDSNSLAFLRARRDSIGAASGVPEALPGKADCAIYLDLATAPENLPAALDRLARQAVKAGADPELCWSAHEADERERLRLFRHALPEAVNQRIAAIRRHHPEITKLGTDMAVPDDQLAAVVALYRQHLDQAALPYLIFGHVGDNHLHVNILPENPEQYRRGRQLYLEFARQVVAMGGSPAAEHGVGKLKKEFLELLLGRRGIEQMREVKRILDPEFRLGRGTLLS